jgi:uncharacterized OsmC-like protein
MRYQVGARRVDDTGSLAVAHGAEVGLGTDLAGRPGAMNPVELLLSALAACMIKGVERVMPVLKFQLDGVEVTLEAERQDAPPKLAAIRHKIVVATDESDARLDLLHRNILKEWTFLTRWRARCRWREPSGGPEAPEFSKIPDRFL